ncbi:monocarboxylate transporter 4-like [Mercenaria mercenaria]|uniref:monocarboxylate transporter 4-like n=1 Tax=Mercenaria mercenaria TaxID=6596 RepID=UPI00234E73DE|nr:monocarboxylate transporter 4-like [Mercenaria mercenaria]
MDCKQVTDGPWSIAVALASFLAQGILGGHVYTTGIFYTIFKQQYPGASEVAISWMCTLPLTLWFIVGPLGSIFTNRYGCRICSVIGGLLASFGLTLCYVSTKFYMVFVFYGLLAGIGNGIHYVGFVTAVNRYFKKYRLIANIISTIGVTFGMAVYAALVPPMTETFGWKGTLLILGGISFNLCALGCALFPTVSQSSSSKVLNIGLLRDKYFLLFGVQYLFCNLSSSMIFLHLPALLLSFETGASYWFFSLTVYGIANCFMKVLYSVIVYLRKPDSSIVYTGSLTISGIVMILLPALQNQVWVIVLVAILGCTCSVTGGHNVEVILYLVGQENVSDGLGFGQVAKASGSLLAGPLAGLLYEASRRYDT